MTRFDRFDREVLLSRAREVWQRTHKEYAEARQKQRESGSENRRSSQVRRDVLRVVDDGCFSHGDGLGDFERGRRSQAEFEACKLGVPFTFFALAGKAEADPARSQAIY